MKNNIIKGIFASIIVLGYLFSNEEVNSIVTNSDNKLGICLSFFFRGLVLGFFIAGLIMIYNKNSKKK